MEGALGGDKEGNPVFEQAAIGGEKTEAEAATLRLETILDTIADGVLVYDGEGKIIFASTAAQEIFPLDLWPDHTSSSAEERAAHYMLRDEQGQPIPFAQSPVHRLLHGEVLKGATALDVIVRADKARELQLSLSGSPMYNAQGTIIGAVVIARDVTERRNLELRTRRALEGLLEMARALVQLPESADGLDIVGRQLAELTCHVLNCRRVGVVVIEPETEIPRPIAVVGLSPDQEQAWWEEQRQQETSLNDSPTPELVALLRANEVLVIDMTRPPFRDQPNPYNITTMLAAPMCIGDRLIGILTLDFGDATHHQYKDEDIALASAVSQLSALVLERQRLLSERAASQSRELALREANARMEEFLGIASHELRTPLTTIKANVQLAMRRLRSLQQQTEALSGDVGGKVEAAQTMLERAERQISVLNRLVSDMVDISRIQANRLQLHLRQEPCDLVTLVQEVIQEQRKTSPERTIELSATTDTVVPVTADPDRIAQVLTNYLSNALKYSMANKAVTVWLEIMEQQVRVLVRDEGPGLSHEEQEQIWECFYQAPGVKVLSGSGVGLGLGLHISRTIIERHHGQVGVQSKHGEGSTFWFMLPLAPLDSHHSREQKQ
ncbi:MAG TPA: PAS domain-containing sensor histidine kinase [Ktedonobacteraceae bacterium]|nr:PAS domain-containing sensor histidine kinase [Ktedonobacteraceae bacterium]